MADVKNLIEPGPRGITKHQMIPAIKENIENEENIKVLYENFSDTFSGSLRYVGKAVREKAIAIIGEVADNEEKKALTERLKPKRKGVTFHQVITALETAAENQDFNEIRLIQKYYPEKFRGSMKYVSKKYREAIEAM